MRALAIVVSCCIGCSAGLPNGATSPDADGAAGDGAPDLGGVDAATPRDLGLDLATSPGAPDLTTAALHLIVQSAPASTGSGEAFTVSFELLDAGGAPVMTPRLVTVAVGLHPTPSTLSGSTSAWTTNGIATLTGLSLDHWGTYTLVGTAPEAQPAETAIVQVRGTRLRWLTQPSNAIAHQSIVPAVRVAIVDLTGDIDTTSSGQVNLWTASSPCPGYLQSGTYGINSGGIVTFDSVVIDTACSGYRIQAAGSYPLDAQAPITSDPFDVVAGAPAALSLQAVVAHSPPSRDTPFDLVAQVLDAGGNQVPLATTVTLSVAPATPIAGPASTTTSGGTATFTGVSLGAVGSFDFTASAAGLQPGSTSVMVTPWQWRSANAGGLLVDPTNPDIVYVDTGVYYPYGAVLARSSDRAATWTDLGVQSDQAVNLAIDPSAPTTLYGSSPSAMWKSLDAGQTSTPLPLAQGWFELTVDPTSPSRLYAVSDSNVWKSADGGASWSSITPAIATHMLSLTVDPTNSAVLYVSGAGVWRSSDGGATWSAASGLASSSYGFSRVAVNPAQPSRLVVCDASGCYRSLDGGANFANVYVGYLGYDRIAVAVDPAAPDHIYACGAYGLATSSDGGQSFTVVPLYPYSVSSCAIAPSHPDTIYITDSDGTWVTTTGGQ